LTVVPTATFLKVLPNFELPAAEAPAAGVPLPVAVEPMFAEGCFVIDVVLCFGLAAAGEFLDPPPILSYYDICLTVI
jgi:hypothetical protein